MRATRTQFTQKIKTISNIQAHFSNWQYFFSASIFFVSCRKSVCNNQIQMNFCRRTFAEYFPCSYCTNTLRLVFSSFSFALTCSLFAHLFSIYNAFCIYSSFSASLSLPRAVLFFFFQSVGVDFFQS